MMDLLAERAIVLRDEWGSHEVSRCVVGEVSAGEVLGSSMLGAAHTVSRPR